MKRLVVLLLVVAALATPVALLVRPTTQASPDVTITVNSTADTNTRDSVMTLREAMLLATGDLFVTSLSYDECQQVSGASWSIAWCMSPVPIGDGTPETIVFGTGVFPPGSPATVTLGSALPTLDTGGDTIDATSAGVIVGYTPQILSPCFDITSDSNTIKGLEINGCYGGAVAIRAGAQGNTIGGTSPGEGNVMSHGGEGDVVEIWGNGTDANAVKGNYIHSNHGNGVVIGSGAQENVIGGSSPGDRNVISGQTISGGGVAIWGSGTRGNVVKGNYIGTDPSGTSPLPNGQWGVYIAGGAQDNTIGGTAAGDRNVISGNLGEGVFISDSGTTGNVVKGNYIGTNASGTAGLPNGAEGVAIGLDARDNTIGGTAAGAGNVVAYNGWDGVYVYSPGATGNTIRGNSIHSNDEEGISNASGGNTELAPPVITGFGSVMGTACANCTVDIYSDDEDEGRVYEGSTTASGAGNWSFSGSLEGPNVTATATDSDGNTSEFSAPVEVPEPTATPSPTATPTRTPTPTPSATPGVTATPPAGPTRTLVWAPGWHNAAWSGSDGTAAGDSFACAAGKFAAAYRFTDAGLERFFPDRPDVSNMGPLNKYNAFLILITQPVTCLMPVASTSGATAALHWEAGWQNVGWAGADGTAPQQAFACADGNYAAAYRFTDAGLERFFPNRPDISNMGPLNKYDAFLILVTAPVNCAMPVAQ